ncbi:MAG: CfrBI family restriction endonuclease [Chloroflexi bacterium]|nr:CfrBI family restriction endonuclease [Chloroflexota bacterium]
MNVPSLYDLATAQGLREIVAALCLGYNYRLYTEGETRNQLIEAYRKLIKILARLPKDADYSAWMDALRVELEESDGSLEWWLLGLGKKTADNLGIRKSNRLQFLEEVGQHLFAATEGTGGLEFKDAMLMLWAGAATLTIRGSRKSTAGKTLERAFLRAALTLLGLKEGRDFWINMERDVEVPREVDAEIATRRGRIRVEMGLIAQGNQEVIEDKIMRVGTRGMVIFDKIGPRSSAYLTAADNQVSFIQIRNNRPLKAMYDSLKDVVGENLVEPPTEHAEIRNRLAELPDELFTSG